MGDKPRFKLKRPVLDRLDETMGSVTLGGYGPNTPPPVDLTHDDPYCEGEEYERYTDEYLDRVNEDGERLSEVSDKLGRLKDAVGSEMEDPDEEDAEPQASQDSDEGDEPVEASDDEPDEKTEDEPDETPEDEPVEASDDEDDDVGVSPKVDDYELEGEPNVEEPEDLSMADRDLPELSTVEDLNRDELEDEAKRLNVWDDIEGTGRDGYRKATDIRDHLKDLIESTDE